MPLALIVVGIIAGIPFFMIVWIAGLAGIPREFYELCSLMGLGANRGALEYHRPTLRPTTLFVVVVTSIVLLQAFSLQYIMTKGGPSNVTTTVALLVYKYGFEYFKMGMATHVGDYVRGDYLDHHCADSGVRSEETSYT